MALVAISDRLQILHEASVYFLRQFATICLSNYLAKDNTLREVITGMRTRFAPSPTGYLHIGGARTALYAWLQAKKMGGTFVLRIEDTDRERSTEESVQAILDSMKWLNLDYDEGPFYQTQRMDRYKEIIDQLLRDGHAYHCYCSKDELEAMREKQMANKEKPRYDGRCRHRKEAVPGVQPVVRFKNPLDGLVVFDDMIKGKIAVDNKELDDLIIARSDGTPTYNLTVVVDDYDMKISHVIRGDDHVNNTPRQINILRALGAELPLYAHVPMILGDDGKRLSKRHGAVSVMQYHEDGYFPEALLNYLVRLGWSHGDQEIFSRDEMINLFNVTEVNRAASTFNPEKLLWVNQQYIKTCEIKDLTNRLQEQLNMAGIDSSQGPDLAQVAEVLRDRARTLKEMAEASRIFYQNYSEFDADAAKKHLRPVAKEALLAVSERLSGLGEWSVESIEKAVADTVAALEIKMPKLAQPLRVAVTGSAASPSIDQTLALIGRERSLAGIAKALQYIEERGNNG